MAKACGISTGRPTASLPTASCSALALARADKHSRHVIWLLNEESMYVWKNRCVHCRCVLILTVTTTTWLQYEMLMHSSRRGRKPFRHFFCSREYRTHQLKLLETKIPASVLSMPVGPDPNFFWWNHWIALLLVLPPNNALALPDALDLPARIWRGRVLRTGAVQGGGSCLAACHCHWARTRNMRSAPATW